MPPSHIPLLLSFHHTQTIGAAAAKMTTDPLSDAFRVFLESCTRLQGTYEETPRPVQHPA